LIPGTKHVETNKETIMSNPFTTKDQLVDIINQVVLGEKKLTDDELKKREEIAQAMERDNPGMDMGKKMAIATAQAKKVAEEVEQIDESEHAVARLADKLETHYYNGHQMGGSQADKESAIQKVKHHISKAPTEHLKALHKTNMGWENHRAGRQQGLTHPVTKHIASELKNRGVVQEEVEQIDEVGNTLKGQIGLRDYKEKAKKDMGDAGEKLWYKSVSDKDTKGKMALIRQRDKRRKGIQRADARIKTEEVNLDEQLENFWEAYTTMFNEAEDQQQNMLLRAMAKDPSDLMKMKRAIKMGDKALTNPALRQEILKMLDQMMTLTTGDKSLLQRTRMGFQKAKTMEMPEEVEQIDERNKENAMRRKVMDASRGARYKLSNKAVPDPEPEHKTAQAHNKAIGRALRNEAIGAKDKQDEGEYGYEGDMAMSQLRTIIRNCQEMMKVLDKETDMPEWVQSKITLATDYLQTANDYLMSELEEETEINELSKGLMYRYFSKADKSGSEKRYAGMKLAAQKTIPLKSSVKIQGTGELDPAKEDKRMRKEETEALDEISKKILGSYVKKASIRATSHSNVAANAQRDSNPDSAGYHRRKEMKLLRGISKATDKLTKEEVESLDELSKKTLGSYIEKAANSGAIHHADVVKKKETADEVDRFTNRNDMNDKYAERERIKKSLGASNADIDNSHRKVSNRFTGLGRAVKRLTKEEVEKAPFEGGREVKSSKSAAERVKKIAKGMEKLNTPKDKK
jgi:hypothetical protein